VSRGEQPRPFRQIYLTARPDVWTITAAVGVFAKVSRECRGRVARRPIAATPNALTPSLRMTPPTFFLPLLYARCYCQLIHCCGSRKPRRPTGSTPKGLVSDASRSEGERVQAANSV